MVFTGLENRELEADASALPKERRGLGFTCLFRYSLRIRATIQDVIEFLFLNKRKYSIRVSLLCLRFVYIHAGEEEVKESFGLLVL